MENAREVRFNNIVEKKGVEVGVEDIFLRCKLQFMRSGNYLQLTMK